MKFAIIFAALVALCNGDKYHCYTSVNGVNFQRIPVSRETLHCYQGSNMEYYEPGIASHCECADFAATKDSNSFYLDPNGNCFVYMFAPNSEQTEDDIYFYVATPLAVDIPRGCPEKCCPPPFTGNGMVGCLFVQTETQNSWKSARRSCHNLHAQADLFSSDDPVLLEIVQEGVAEHVGVHGRYWIGGKRGDSGFALVGDGQNVSESNWSHSPESCPVGGAGNDCLLINTDRYPPLCNDRDCDVSLSSICAMEAKLQYCPF